MKANIYRIVSYTGAVILLTLISFWRIPARAQGVVWAEDGNIFLADAMQPFRFSSLFRPYAGYLHVVPRAAAEIVVRFADIADYAVWMSVLACAAVAVVSVLTYHCAHAITRNVWMRAGWAAIPVLVNVGALETLGNFANFHWYLLWLAPWLLIKPAQSIAGGAGLFVFSALTSLTEIISIVFLPLFLYRWRDREYWPARCGLILGLGCQIYTTLSFPRPHPGGYQLDPLSVFYGWFINTAAPVVYGSSANVLGQILNFGAAPIIIASAVVGGAVVAVMRLGTRRDRRLAGLFLAASALVWTACVVVNPAYHLDYARFTAGDWNELFHFSRYSVAPTMFMLGIGPVLASALRRVSPRAPMAVLTAFALLLVSMYFPQLTRRDDGPVWADAVLDGTTACAAASVVSVDIPVAPSYYTGVVTIPCHLLATP